MRRKLHLIGTTAALVGLVIALTRNGEGIIEKVLVGGGALLMLGAALLQTGRLGNTINSLKAGLYSFFILASLVALFVLALPRLPRLDMTSTGMNSLSEIGAAYLQQIDEPVELVAFTYDVEDFTHFFERIKAVNPDHISYAIYNPFKDVEKAREFADQVYPDDVFVRIDGQTERMKGRSEGLLINKIVAAQRTGPDTLYFLTGHGEMSPVPPKEQTDQLKSMSQVSNLLRERGFQVDLLDIQQQRRVPGNAAALVIFAPLSRLADAERDAILSYLSSGGKLVMSLGLGDATRDPMTRPVLKSWALIAAAMGVQIKDRGVVDVVATQMFPSQPIPALPAFLFGMQPISPNDDTYRSVIFLLSRAMQPLDDQPDGTQATPLLYSSEQSLTRETAQLFKGADTFRYDPEELKAEPLLIRSEREFAQEDGSVETAKALFFASPYPFIDAALHQASARMFVSAVDQLTEEIRSELIDIPETALPDQAPQLSVDEFRFLIVFHLLFLPGIVFFGGLGWTMRRRLQG
jgi:hypothetical protein